MPDSSVLLSQFYLTLNGAEAPPDLMRDLIEVSVESSVHLPDVTTLLLHDPGLRWIDADALAPGTRLLVAAEGHGAGRQTIFDGEIVELEPDFGPRTQRLTVRAFDRLHRLTRGRHVRSFQNVSDGDLVRTIAREVGLRAEVDPTPQIQPYVLQGNETNAAFLRRRAAALGYLLYARGETLYCRALHAGSSSTIEAEWGVALQAFHPRLASGEQIDRVVVRGWDPQTCSEVIGSAAHSDSPPRVAAASVSVGQPTEVFVTDRPVRTQDEAGRLAQAAADRIAGRLVEADGTCLGTPALIAGAPLRVSAVGRRFGGTYWVTRATHTYNAHEGYLTHFSASGHNPATLLGLLRPEDAAPSAEMAIGIVTDNQDPDGLGRIRVRFPWLSGDHASDWARVVVPGGMAFLPDVDDEVLVGFEFGDLQYPYVLGRLWNGRSGAPSEVLQSLRHGRVSRSLLRSRSGHTITFDDSERGGITIADRSGRTVRLDAADKGGGITITDNRGSTIALGAAALTLSITTQGQLRLEARGAVHIKGAAVTVEAVTQPLELKGTGATLDGGHGPAVVRGDGATLDGGARAADVRGTGLDLDGGARALELKGSALAYNGRPLH